MSKYCYLEVHFENRVQPQIFLYLNNLSYPILLHGFTQELKFSKSNSFTQSLTVKLSVDNPLSHSQSKLQSVTHSVTQSQTLQSVTHSVTQSQTLHRWLTQQSNHLVFSLVITVTNLVSISIFFWVLALTREARGSLCLRIECPREIIVGYMLSFILQQN